jgi:hypothetical protein
MKGELIIGGRIAARKYGERLAASERYREIRGLDRIGRHPAKSGRRISPIEAGSLSLGELTVSQWRRTVIRQGGLKHRSCLPSHLLWGEGGNPDV